MSYQEVVQPKQYSREFRRAACERLVAGEKVSSFSKELGSPEGSSIRWKRQTLIGAGRAEGIKSVEADELAQAHRTIAEFGRARGGQGGGRPVQRGGARQPKGDARLPKA